MSLSMFIKIGKVLKPGANMKHLGNENNEFTFPKSIKRINNQLEGLLTWLLTVINPTAGEDSSSSMLCIVSS